MPIPYQRQTLIRYTLYIGQSEMWRGRRSESLSSFIQVAAVGYALFYF